MRGRQSPDTHDMSLFATVKHFCSWLGLCTGTRITGGKVLSGKTKRVVNRHCVWSPLHSEAASRRSARTSAGCARGWTNPRAVTAAAHKLARLIYILLTKSQDYYEQRYRERVLANLSGRAQQLGMKMVAIEQPAWKYPSRSIT